MFQLLVSRNPVHSYCLPLAMTLDLRKHKLTITVHENTKITCNKATQFNPKGSNLIKRLIKEMRSMCEDIKNMVDHSTYINKEPQRKSI